MAFAAAAVSARASSWRPVLQTGSEKNRMKSGYDCFVQACTKNGDKALTKDIEGN
jgi:hypothetical protein